MERRQRRQTVPAAQDFERIRHSRREQRHYGEIGLNGRAFRQQVTDLADRPPVAPGMVQRLDREWPEGAVLPADRHR